LHPIERILERSPVMILDGALATELERRGLNLDDPLWSAKALVEAPGTIQRVHRDYFAAGADAAITATYQASVDGFSRRGIGRSEAMDLMGRAVRLAASARDDFWSDPRRRADRPRPLVAASIGPYGAYLADGSEYRGDYEVDAEDLAAFHRPRLDAVVSAGADILACETLPCRAEAEVLAGLLALYPGVSAWFSFSCRDGERLWSGDRLADCAGFLDDHPQVAAVGVNCTEPRFVPDLIRSARRRTGKPIAAYPNSGERYDPRTRTWTGDADPNAFARAAKDWFAAGARIIGGCCRTTPDDIRAIAAWARRLPGPTGGDAPSGARAEA
jgi:homocysteine S-methyltransferase